MDSFRIINTKSFADSGDVELKPLTVLVGKNSCGKSSLLRFPAVLGQTVNESADEPPISFFGDYIDYGNYENIVFRKNESSGISFSLTYTFDISGNTDYSLNDRYLRVRKLKDSKEDCRKVTVQVKLKKIVRQVEVEKIEFFIDEQQLSCVELINNGQSISFKIFAYYNEDNIEIISEEIVLPKSCVEFKKFFPKIYSNDIVRYIAKAYNWNVEEEIIDGIARYSMVLYSLGIVDDELLNTNEAKQIADKHKYFLYSIKIIENFYSLFMMEFKGRIAYIGPFRKTPDRIYRKSESHQMHVGAKGENVSEMLLNLKYSKIDDDVFSKVSEWIEEFLGYKVDIIEKDGSYFQIVLSDSCLVDSNITDVGFGISQVLPIVLEICNSAYKKRKNPKSMLNDIIMIEQPELHLHPAAQASLADLLTIGVLCNSKSRIIVETHSEHLISKLQVLIADPKCKLTNEMIQILYVDKDETGCSFIKKMSIKENGKFETEWPSDFFDQGYQLSLQLMRNAAAHSKGKNNG